MSKNELFKEEIYNRAYLADLGDGLLLFDVGCSLSRNRCDKEYACNAPKPKDGRCTFVEALRSMDYCLDQGVH